jgi:hypothetical protein
MEVKQMAIEFKPRIAKTLQTNTWHQNQTWPQEGDTLG